MVNKLLSLKKFILKIIEHISSCWTYTFQFCLGKGYPKFICWECETEIQVTKRKRFVKCPKCSRWNMHPIWADRGENLISFAKKIYLPNLMILLIIVLSSLSLNWCINVYVEISS